MRIPEGREVWNDMGKIKCTMKITNKVLINEELGRE